MKKLFALILTLSFVMAGCSYHNIDDSVSSKGLLENETTQQNTISSPYGEVTIYPLVQKDIELYIEDSAVQGEWEQEDIEMLKTFINAYAGILYNIDEDFDAEGIENLVMDEQADYFIQLNQGITERVEAVQLLNVAFGDKTTANIDYVIRAFRSGEGLPDGIYNFVGKMTVEKIDGKWVRTELLSSGNYSDSQYMLRDSITKEIYIQDVSDK